jgi:hypothetical protein
MAEMARAKSIFFVLKYSDNYSTANSSIRDYEIGAEHHLFGCIKKKW